MTGQDTRVCDLEHTSENLRWSSLSKMHDHSRASRNVSHLKLAVAPLQVNFTSDLNVVTVQDLRTGTDEPRMATFDNAGKTHCAQLTPKTAVDSLQGKRRGCLCRHVCNDGCVQRDLDSRPPRYFNKNLNVDDRV
jgi:hypothetical protein